MISRTFAIGSLGPATAADAAMLAPNLRESDLFELAAHDGREPLLALTQSIEQAKFALALRASEGETVSLLGVNWIRANPRAGSIWFVSDERLDQFGLVFLEHVKLAFDDLVAGHDVVSNWIHEPNTKTVRWLTWMGFEVLSRHRSDRSGEWFLEMARFASPAVRDLYVKRDWNAYHATLPARDAIRALGFALTDDAEDAGRQGANFSLA